MLKESTSEGTTLIKGSPGRELLIDHRTDKLQRHIA